jgi:hypothetical protein
LDAGCVRPLLSSSSSWIIPLRKFEYADVRAAGFHNPVKIYDRSYLVETIDREDHFLGEQISSLEVFAASGISFAK